MANRGEPDRNKEEEKRIIRVGFFLPKPPDFLDSGYGRGAKDKTIYVCIETVACAKAYSNQPFFYKGEKVKTGGMIIGYHVSNSDRDYNEFIENLRKNNRGVVEDNCLRDGLEILIKLKEIQNLAIPR